MMAREPAEEGAMIPTVVAPRPLAVRVRPERVKAELYTGSNTGGINSDFLGDWRSVDSWMRFDMMKARNRSRQLERGNPWCKSFKTSLVNNVIGHKGFYQRPDVLTSPVFGDTTTGVSDEAANTQIRLMREEFEKPENFTTRKRLSRKDTDILMLCRLAFDGEVIFRKIPKFDNSFGFSWQMINPDYLDHNLNRLEPNGNFTRMGVELDKDFKFPVAYWFLRRRPNDQFYNWQQFPGDYYFRVPAKDILHIFIQTEDDEQTRGWPWLFAAVVQLHRMGKFEEAALINAAIGASKMGFFKKTVPDGFAGDPNSLEDNGDIIDEVTPGSWQELPWNVEPVPFDPKYPDAELEPFSKHMLRGVAAAAGMSYMSMTGDLSDSNFSSSRIGQVEEREQWMQIQEFVIDHWKDPEWEETLFRSMLARKVNLPISRFDKFKRAKFRGRRWPYINPIQDWQAKQMALDNCATSVSEIIEEGGGEPSEVFTQISKDEERFKELGIGRIRAAFQIVDYEQQDESAKPISFKNPPKKKQ